MISFKYDFKKPFLYVLLYSLLFWSCNEDSSVKQTPDGNVDIPSYINVFSNGAFSKIFDDDILDDADCVLLSRIVSEHTGNGEMPNSNTLTDVAAFFKYPNSIEYCKVNNINLSLTDKCPSRFVEPDDWVSENSFSYEDQLYWEFKTDIGETVRDTINLCKTLRPITIGSDTISLSQPVTVTWNQQSGDGDIYLCFHWSYFSSDTTTETDFFDGLTFPDNGGYTFEAGELSNYGIPDSGALMFDFYRARLNEKYYNDGNDKLINLTITDAAVPEIFLEP